MIFRQRRPGDTGSDNEEPGPGNGEGSGGSEL